MNSFRMLSLLVLTVSTLTAQNTLPSLKLTGDLRFRSELDGRDFNLRTPANGYTLSRIRIAVEVAPVEDAAVFIQVRDSRSFGSVSNTLGDAKNLDLHQGYVHLVDLFADGLSMKLGRQEVSFGTERIVGMVGWHNVGRVFDGLRLTMATTTLNLDLLAFNTAEVQPYQPVASPGAAASVHDAGSDLYGIYTAYKVTGTHTVEGYVLYQSDRNQSVAGSDDLARFTLGGHLFGNVSAIDFDAEGAFQGGERRGADVSAFLLAVNAGFSTGMSFLPRISAGYELLSGTPTTSTKHQSFDPMFHTGHKFYGFMDYFIGFPTNTADRGLVDVFGRVQTRFAETISGTVTVHNFSQAQSVGGGTALGQEIDADVQYRHNQKVSFQAGMSAFLPAILMRQRFGAAGTAYWAYFQTTVGF